MTRVIYLSPGEPRCSGSNCKHPNPCARKLADGRPDLPLGDFSFPTGYGQADCWGPTWKWFKSLVSAVKPASGQGPKEWIGRMVE